MTNNLAYRGFDEPRRLVTDLPEDVSSALTRLALPTATRSCAAASGRAYFEVYRADRVSLTSILFSGGDWRWRFCAPDGTLIATSAGYRDERSCASAVAALRGAAGRPRSDIPEPWC